MEVGAEAPAGEEDEHEVEEDERHALLGLLDEGRVEMHVVLGGEIVVQDGVDILKSDHAGLLVRLAELGVGAMEVAAASAHCKELGNGECGASAEGSGEQVQVRIKTHI